MCDIEIERSERFWKLICTGGASPHDPVKAAPSWKPEAATGPPDYIQCFMS